MRKMILTLILCSLLVLPVNAAAPTVALTFDDGPSGRFTRALLDGLAERNVKATFFLCGYRIRQYPELAQRIAEEGHEIGCHGFSHDSMAAMSRRDIYEDMADIFYDDAPMIGEILLDTIRSIDAEDKHCECEDLRKETLLKDVYNESSSKG